MSDERAAREPRGGGWLLLGAALVHVAVMVGCWALYTWIYTSPAPPVTEPTTWHMTEVVLCLGAGLGGALTAAGVWRVTARASGWRAAALIGLVGLPCALLACTWLYAVAIFRGWL
ncbi:MAG: hypothetical protein CMH57_12925 [Myxococcales bacterium]|nr:hypothetical protein [Myxococcales bacterium]